MNVYVIYSETESLDAVRILNVAFSEEMAKAEVMRLMADACRARSVAELNYENPAYVTYRYEAVRTLDEMKEGNHVL